MKKLHILLLAGFSILSLSMSVSAKSISVNFGISTGDANTVNAGESSIIGISDAESNDGSKWNNLNLRASGSGAPTTFTAATQGANHIDLIDSSGSDSAVDLTSTGDFFSNFTNTSAPNQANTGDAGLLQSFINLNSSESISLSGLSSWAPNGYKVYAVFDIGPVNRTYAVTMTDGSTSQAFWTADTSGTDADTDNDGVIEWIRSSATTSTTAVTDANYSVFGIFTEDTLTISGDATTGRATLSGFQIVALTEPPATIHSFTVNPTSFQTGESVTLNWSVSDADTVSIDQGIGSVTENGSTPATPTATTTWTLTATRNGTSVTAQATATLSKGPIAVYLLGGQSNMQGTARSSKLPPQLLSIPEILLYAAGSGVSGNIANQLVTLQPSNGSTFGPEIGFGERMSDLCKGQKIAFIKYSASGNSLEINFKPGANAADTTNWGGSFTAMVNTYNNGIAALEADGWEPEIKGMIWQQGEQDAKDGLNVPESNTSADNYGANLSHFIDRVREQFAAHASTDGIRFVAGQVLPYAPAGGDVATRFPGRDLVRQAILNADEDSGAALAVSNTGAVPTDENHHPTHKQEVDGHNDNDEVHLNHVAQLALGKSMAYEMLKLSPQVYSDWSTGYSLTGGQADDDDNDGIDNQSEYFLGTDPTDATSAGFPTANLETINGNVYLTLAFTRNLNALSVQGTAQVSENLLSWNQSAEPTLIETIKNNDNTSTFKYRAPWEVSDQLHPKVFMRLKISP